MNYDKIKLTKSPHSYLTLSKAVQTYRLFITHIHTVHSTCVQTHTPHVHNKSETGNNDQVQNINMTLFHNPERDQPSIIGMLNLVSSQV